MAYRELPHNCIKRRYSAVEYGIVAVQRQKVHKAISITPISSEPDFEICCDDGGHVNAHSRILADSCRYFDRMMKTYETASRIRGTTFVGSTKVMEIIVNYLYGLNGFSKLIISFEEMLDIVWYSDRFELDNSWISYSYSVLTCDEFLNISNFFDIWNVSSWIEADVSKKKVEEFVKNNIQVIVRDKNFKLLCLHSMKSLLRLIDKTECSDLIEEAIAFWRSEDSDREHDEIML